LAFRTGGHATTNGAGKKDDVGVQNFGVTSVSEQDRAMATLAKDVIIPAAKVGWRTHLFIDVTVPDELMPNWNQAKRSLMMPLKQLTLVERVAPLRIIKLQRNVRVCSHPLCGSRSTPRASTCGGSGTCCSSLRGLE
jgi:hypothetical protein